MKCPILIFVATLFAGAYTQQLVKCPEMSVMTDFNIEKYMGVWYENQKYPFAFEVLGRCISAKYGMNADGTVSISNKAFNIIFQKWDEIIGTGTVVDSGKLKVKFTTGIIKTAADYWILGTDYTNYAVVYSCSENFKFIKGQKVWILTREIHPSKEVVENALRVLDKHDLTRDLLQKSYQTNCPRRTLF
uniref:Apolipoprotein D n=1 Tax=Dolopus genitalis TaxID=2488630 RepID=A0A3G5BIK1_DOLGE|nr:venom polypeptide [Dolopus genitalis]